jgi:hypothetical protein
MQITTVIFLLNSSRVMQWKVVKFLEEVEDGGKARLYFIGYMINKRH